MNLKLLYVSVLMFGVVGLLLFMYLQAWIEEQHAESEEKLQQKAIYQVLRFHSTEELGRIAKAWITAEHLGIPNKARKDSIHVQEDGSPFLEMPGSLIPGLSEEPQRTTLLLQPFKQAVVPPAVNKAFINNSWKTRVEMQEKRKCILQDFCRKHAVRENRSRFHLVRMVSRIYVEDKHKLLYCEVPKAGCSNWKRVLIVLSGLARSAANISHDTVHYGKHLKKLDSYGLKGIRLRLKTYTKVIFVRDPMERLVSAFRDKFEHPNSYYHPIFGKAIIKKYRLNPDREALATGSGVTFNEFVKYLLDPRRPVSMDTHWEQIHKLCSPCLINYDFIGKFETLEEDANAFLRLIGAPEGLAFPNFKDRHATDRRTNSEVVQQYLAKIPDSERQQAYDFYYLDYLMFNYTVPYAQP